MLSKDNSLGSLQVLRTAFKRFFPSTSSILQTDIDYLDLNGTNSDIAEITDSVGKLPTLSMTTYDSLLDCLNEGMVPRVYLSYQDKPRPHTWAIQPHVQEKHSVKYRGVTYSCSSKHLGNSRILFRLANETLQRAGAIQRIFIHQRHGPSNTLVTEFFYVVRQYRELSDAQAAYDPYRQFPLLFAIPIHQQSFPLRKRVQVKPTTVVELLDEDVVPIHRRRFPLTTAVPDFDKTGDSRAAVPVSVCQEHESYLTSLESIVPERQEQKIRNLDAVVGRYVTRHELPLRHPPPCPHAKSGDLYIHRYDGNRGIQIWVRDVDCWKANVVDGHHHPVLPDYRLYIADGTGPTNTDGGCTSLLTQFECVHEISIDANPELAELAELLDRGVLVPPPSKPVQPKLLLYDVLMTVILLFLFVLVGLDIWSHFVVVHGA
ncbi:hypothetical protein EDD15DRAFT_2361258 [Pisolithus albus]|nr:hypothetical protein EDD15DRAFT_2361258 [Pisolithus albus]